VSLTLSLSLFCLHLSLFIMVSSVSSSLFSLSLFLSNLNLNSLPNSHSRTQTLLLRSEMLQQVEKPFRGPSTWVMMKMERVCRLFVQEPSQPLVAFLPIANESECCGGAAHSPRCTFLHTDNSTIALHPFSGPVCQDFPYDVDWEWW